jgi:hypothetical protein
MLMASRRLTGACKFLVEIVAVGDWNTLSKLEVTSMVARSMRPSSGSSRGKRRLRAAIAEPLAEDAPRFPGLFWKPDRSHRNKDGVDMMLISLSLRGHRVSDRPTEH